MSSSMLNELVDLIGLPACLALARKYGGRTIRVPIAASTTHPLHVTIGETAMVALCKEFGGVHIEIPAERTALMEQRNRLICEEVLGGRKVLTTARRYGISPKMVRNILQQRGVGKSPTLP